MFPMSVRSFFSKQFESNLSLYAEDLHLSAFQCSLYSKKFDKLEKQTLSKIDKRSEFEKWVESRVQVGRSKDANATLPALVPLTFDRSEIHYRVMRIYDETFGLRPIFSVLIDSYYDENKISAQRALQLLAFVKYSEAIEGPSSLLDHIQSSYDEKKITATQAAKLIDLMECLPTPFLSMISEWHVDKSLPGEDAMKLIALAAIALTLDSEEISLEDLSFLPVYEPEDLAEAAFKERIVELKKQKGIPLRSETIALFAQVVFCIGKMDVYNNKVWFLHFFYAFMDWVGETSSTIKSEHLDHWNDYFDSQKSDSGSDIAQPKRPSFISRNEREAYSYWIPRIYDEIYDARNNYDRCIDQLYDDEQLTMNTANKLLALPDQVEEESEGSRYFRFSQKLSAIRNPKTLPERFSAEAFNLILKHYQ